MTKKMSLIAITYLIVIITVSILLGSCGSSHATCDAYGQVNIEKSNDTASK
jgi:hypothetical protein